MCTQGVREDLAHTSRPREGRFAARGVVPEGRKRRAAHHDSATHLQVNILVDMTLFVENIQCTGMTIQVVQNLHLTSKQNFRFSMRPMY